MTDTNVSARARVNTTGGAFYRLVWKWHFLASLYVLPFMMMLATTGGIYLYKPQIEGWLYADQMNVQAVGEPLSYEMQLAELEANFGITRIRGITNYDDPTRSTMVEFNDAAGTRTIAWINPYTGEVLGNSERDTMPMQMLRKFHGELLLGNVGTKFVELAAHWAIVMFVTGAYLWWPRGNRTLRKAVSLPQGAISKRSFWRETHLFTGLLATVLVVPMIFAGLPWTDVWGGGLSYIQQQTGQDSKSLRFSRDVPNSTVSEGTTLPLADIFYIAQENGLLAPYEVRPPRTDEAAFWVRSDAASRDDQSELIIDQYSGAILQRFDFADNPIVARTVSKGISFHQGELYGWLNLAQNTLAAFLVLVLSVSGFVAWWKRKPEGKLGVPAAPEAALGIGMIGLIVFLSVLFPLVGASLIVALILDWALFRRVGWFRS